MAKIHTLINNMYLPLLKSHSGLRWLVLAGFIGTLFALWKARKNGGKAASIRSLALFTLISTHLQFVFGILLYFTSPKVVFKASAMSDKVQRFFLVEHISLMLVAIVLLTIGYVKWKKRADLAAAKALFRYYLIALILILISIPWPFRIAGSHWF